MISRGYIGIMERKGLYRDNGKEDGNYHITIGYILGYGKVMELEVFA